MSDYMKYQHVEKLGCDEVEDILMGTVHVFPKIDGTNGHVWRDEDTASPYICFGSRNRQIVDPDNDNAGFRNAMEQFCDEWNDLFDILPEGCHVYGEWLVKHSLKTYRDSAWKQFYIFDIMLPLEDTLNRSGERYMRYEDYQPILEKHGFNYIPPMRIIKKPNVDNLLKVLDENTYLIKDGEGVGEGVVLKNYDYVNSRDRQIWAKIVATEFKEKHIRTLGAPTGKSTDYVEEKIIEEFLTGAMVDKVHAKIKIENDGWSSKYIPKLLSMVWNDLINECMWEILKKFKNPTIDFKVLNRFMIVQIKQYRSDLF